MEKPDGKWFPTTPQEIRAFIGINMIMGIDRKPSIPHYWSTDPFLGNQGIQSVVVKKTEVSIAESAITLFSHLPMVHGFTGAYGFLTVMKRGLVSSACLIF